MHRPHQHEQLAKALHGCAAAVVLSGYPSALYHRLYADWHHVAIPAWTGQPNNRDAGHRTEVLWSNRDLDPSTLPFDRVETP
jgi:DNA adenine methylase